MLFRNHPALERLSRIPLFGSCTRKQLVRIDRLATELTVGSGRVLQHERANASAFYVIETGHAAISVGGRPVGDLQAGDFFGEAGLLERSLSAATVTAASRTDVIVFTREEFFALLEVAGPTTRTIMRACAAHTWSAKHHRARLELQLPLPSAPQSAATAVCLEESAPSDVWLGTSPVGTAS